MLRESLNFAFTLLYEGLVRCFRMSHGTSLRPILHAMDISLKNYIISIESIIKSVGLTSVNIIDGAAASDASHTTSILFLLPLIYLANTKLDSLQNFIMDQIQGNMLQLVEFIDQAGTDSNFMNKYCSNARGGIFLAILRLSKQQNEIQYLREVYEDKVEFMKSAQVQLQEWQQNTDASIEAALTIKLEKLFSEMDSSKLISDTEGAPNMPKFSSYPLQYIISSGEYLMMMPQLLESAWGDQLSDDYIGSWIDKVAIKSCKMYCLHLSKIKGLSESGTQQLSADVDYFCNIMNSLGQEIPDELSAWQAALATNDSDSMKVLLENIKDKKEIQSIINTVSRLRGFEL